MDSSNYDEIIVKQAEITTSKVSTVLAESIPLKINDFDKSIDFQHESKAEISNVDFLNKKIIITIPAYNEEEIIEDVIKRITDVMMKTRYQNNFAIQVVDDGSTDDTATISKQAGALVHSHNENSGLAETFRTEMRFGMENNGDIIVHIDADGQYRAEEIPNLLIEIERGYDLVLGSRFMGKIEHMPFIKKIGNKIFSKVISRITKEKITDSQTGFRAFTSEVAEKIDIISTHTYTQEQIIRAFKANFRIKEIPIHFDVRKNGKSRLIKNSIEYALKALKTLYRIQTIKN